MTSEPRAWLALVLTPGLGPVKIQELIGSLGSAEEILQTDRSLLMQAGLSEEQIATLKQPDTQALESSLQWLDDSPSHHLITFEHPDYPPLLKKIPDPPPVLFAKGNPALLPELNFAIVGSRNPSRQGEENAYQFARHLASMGLSICSGLALGIDGASHRGALAAKGKTVAVCGNGLDRIYPARHRDLAHQIAEEGLLVSEYQPGTRPLPGHFPRRNRIISGLTLGTLVVEAALKSGSLITAYQALDQCREVFAIPGSIHNPLARGCHQLIREGAKLVESAQDILEELGSIAVAGHTISNSGAKHSDKPFDTTENHELSAPQSLILDAMGYDPVDIDTLVERTGMTTSELSSTLLILELQNKITTEAGGHYIRKAET